MTDTVFAAPPPAHTDPSAAALVDPALVAFIYHEARLADEARYSEWEALWDDRATYWVPMAPDADPETQVSYINDNRTRIRSRVAQLNTGVRHSQTPPSSTGSRSRSGPAATCTRSAGPKTGFGWPARPCTWSTRAAPSPRWRS
jgi:hypothetical protein